DSAFEQPGSELEFGAIRRDHNRAEVVVYDCGEARRTKDAPHLSECADLIANVHQHSVRIGHVESRLRERQVVDGRGEELDVLNRPLGGRSPGLADLFGVRVNPDHATGSDRSGKVEGDASDSAADVENVHAGAHMWKEEREKTARVAVGDVSLLHALLH